MSGTHNKSNVRRGDVYWVNLDPALGTEAQKTRPAVVISNDAQNMIGQRYIVAPITSALKNIYPFEVKININGKFSKAMLDQIRTIDHQRLKSKISMLSREEMLGIEKSLKVVLQIS